MSKGGSGGESDEGMVPEPIKKVARTVTPPFQGRPDAEMTLIGTAYFLGLVILLIPLLPFMIVVWLISKIMGVVARLTPTERLPGRESSR